MMDRVGKYTIGSRVLNKDGKPVEGIYVFGKFGLPYICTNLDSALKERDSIYVIDDLDTAQNYIRYLSRNYRYEFRGRAKQLGVSAGEFKFYLVKLTDHKFDNLEFDFECKNITLKKDVGSKYEFLGDYHKVHVIGIKPKSTTT